MKNIALNLETVLKFKGAIGDGSLPSIGGALAKTSVLYLAGLSTSLAAKNGEILLTSNKPEVGISNFPEGQKLPAGQSFTVIGVRLLMDVTSSVTVTTATWKSEPPANWKNGEIVVSQKGAGELLSVPVSAIAGLTALTSTADDRDFFEVIPFTFRPQADISINAQLASAGAADQAFRIEFLGFYAQDAASN